ncbi:MAG: beta-ketoacyl synthase N-terminal-like domain-containing protein [Desulfobacteraceae bacterium]
MSSQRIMVTELGAITPIGNTKKTYWQQLLAGVSGIRRVQFPNLNMDQYRTRIAASVQDFEVSDYLPADKKNKYHGRATLFALAAARMALEDAGFELCADHGRFRLSGIDPYRVGVIITGGADSGVNPTIFSGFTALKAMSTQNDAPESACRPFAGNLETGTLSFGRS